MLILISTCIKEINIIAATATLGKTLTKGYSVDTTTAYNNIIIISSYTANIFKRDSAHNTFAYARIAYTGTPTNTNQITLGNVPLNTGNNYYQAYPLAEGKALLGASLAIQAPILLNGSPSSSGTTTVPVPKEIYPSNIGIPKNYINRFSADPIN